MNSIKRCESCKIYTLKEECPKCKNKTMDPSYKFPKIRDEPKKDFRRR